MKLNLKGDTFSIVYCTCIRVITFHTFSVKSPDGQLRQGLNRSEASSPDQREQYNKQLFCDQIQCEGDCWKRHYILAI